jgi:Glycosyl transferase family 2
MLQILYFIYSWKFKSSFFDSYYARVVIRLTNIFVPLYFRLTGWLPHNHKISSLNGKKANYIVSLTSFPIRIKKVWLTIETILRQKVKPDLLILWLYKQEFNGEVSLPKRLLKLKKRGLQIRFCDENLMPHKKYYYTILEYPEANIITIDDDVFYPPDFLYRIIKFHNRYPDSICCTRTRRIKVVDHRIRPYKEWSGSGLNSPPGYLNLFIGAGGTLFPANSLHKDVLNKNELIRFALEADDLWLKIMSLKNKTKVASLTGEYTRCFIPLIYKNNSNLMDKNIGKGQNDKIFKQLIDFYNIPVSIFEEN